MRVGFGRFGLSKLHWALNKLAKGAGAGADPTEIDVPSIPSGLIAMWHGTIGNIPAGWVLCDGENSTPNLLTRFVQGVATAETNPGATGGASSKTTSGHQHQIPFGLDGSNLAYDTDEYGTGTNFSASHFADGGTHATTEASGLAKSKTDSISDIRPLFYDVAFIMNT